MSWPELALGVLIGWAVHGFILNVASKLIWKWITSDEPHMNKASKSFSDALKEKLKQKEAKSND